MGRPAEFGTDVADLICIRLVAGQTLREICRDEAMPHRSTVCRWLAARPGFREQYARARGLQADGWADELVEIADGLDGEHIQRSRLRVDARKWLMARAAPKKYGDKVALEHAGKDGGHLVVEIVRLGGGMPAVS